MPPRILSTYAHSRDTCSSDNEVSRTSVVIAITEFGVPRKVDANGFNDRINYQLDGAVT